MTAPRRPRSAWLLVGSTPSVWVNVQSAGQRLRRFLANCRWYLVLGLLRAACSSIVRSLFWSGAVWAWSRARILLVAVPGGEEVVGDPEARVAELFLLGHALAVGGEVSEQVGPAELAAGRVEVVVAAPAVRADDPGEALAEQRSGLEGVPAGRDPEHRGAAGQCAPERPTAAGGLPAGLVDVDDRGRPDPLLELRVRAGERRPGPLDDPVDRPGRKLDPEQLPGELARVAPRDTVPDRERHDRGLQPRPERRARNSGRQLSACPRRALRAAHPVKPMLSDPNRDRGQLGDLVAPRLHGIYACRLAEHVRA